MNHRTNPELLNRSANFDSSLYTKSSLLEKVVGLGERGKLQIEVQEVIKDAFDEETQGWKRAIELVESARIRGKVVLTIP